MFYCFTANNADFDELCQYEISIPLPAFFCASEINIDKSKSALMDCMIRNSIVLTTSANCSAIFKGESFIAKFHKPKGVKNIGEYIESTFISLINIY